MKLRILFDEEGLVVVDKPPGLESTGRSVDDPRGVQHHLQAQLRRPVWLVHQLDRDTSGVLVFVRKRSLVATMSTAMRSGGGAEKRYLALVSGPLPGRRRVDAALAYDKAARRWVVSKNGKPARTTFEARSVAENATLLEATLHTGRTHQIRVHLAHLGHPLLGERRYAECRRAPRQALHAWRLRLANGIAFEAPVPDDFRAVAASEGLEVQP